ncbi:MAG: flagellar motor switch protein FliN [SAR324 cluster bacterium]|nr:flagellar motor switch protein FliN [SAR324 cluster bacterium]
MAEMDQDAIDALLNGVGGEEEKSDTPPPAEDSSGGEVDQAGIDALFEGSSANEPEAEPTESLDQNNIDALFDNPGTEDTGSSMDAEDSGSDEMDALLAEFGSASIGQDEEGPDIDSLLTEIQSDPSSDDIASGQDSIDALLDTVVDGSGLETGTAAKEEEGVNSDFLLDMKLVLTFEVGRSQMLIGDLLSLGQGSVIELHRLVGEDLDMFVHGRLIAKGEVVVVNEKFGVRILDIITPEERVKKMAGLDSLV